METNVICHKCKKEIAWSSLGTCRCAECGEPFRQSDGQVTLDTKKEPIGRSGKYAYQKSCCKGCFVSGCGFLLELSKLYYCEDCKTSTVYNLITEPPVVTTKEERAEIVKTISETFDKIVEQTDPPEGYAFDYNKIINSPNTCAYCHKALYRVNLFEYCDNPECPAYNGGNLTIQDQSKDWEAPDPGIKWPEVPVYSWFKLKCCGAMKYLRIDDGHGSAECNPKGVSFCGVCRKDSPVIMDKDYDPDKELEKVIYDPVNHPKHYNSHPSGVECITITRHMGFNIGNAIKYLWRADLKDEPVENLQKAIWYIEDEIKLRKGEFKVTEKK